MKLEWQIPVLEVLDVNETMHQVKFLKHTDATFPAGTEFPDMRWS